MPTDIASPKTCAYQCQPAAYVKCTVSANVSGDKTSRIGMLGPSNPTVPKTLIPMEPAKKPVRVRAPAALDLAWLSRLGERV